MLRKRSVRPPKSPNPSDDGGLSVALNIASVEVTNGQLSLVDQLAQREWQADKLTINGSNVNPDTAFPLSSTFQLRVYDLVPGSRGEVMKAWSSKIDGRRAYSPLAGCWLNWLLSVASGASSW